MNISRRGLLKVLGIGSVAAVSGVSIAKEAKRIHVGANSPWNDVHAAAKTLSEATSTWDDVQKAGELMRASAIPHEEWVRNAKYRAAIGINPSSKEAYHLLSKG